MLTHRFCDKAPGPAYKHFKRAYRPFPPLPAKGNPGAQRPFDTDKCTQNTADSLVRGGE